MNQNRLDLGIALGEGWDAIKRHPGPVVGGIVIYCIIIALLGLLQKLSFVAQAFLMPPLLGGLLVLLLKAADNRDPRLEDLFSGFRSYWRWMGLQWLWQVILIAAALPLIIGIGLIIAGRGGFSGLFTSLLGGIITLAGLGVLTAAVAIVMRWVFSYWLVAEGAGTLEAFEESARLTEGKRFDLFWMLLVLGLLGAAGVIVLGVGVFVTASLSSVASARLYRQLRPLPTTPGIEAASTETGEGTGEQLS